MEITIKINRWQLKKLFECERKFNNESDWKQDLESTLTKVLESYLNKQEE